MADREAPAAAPMRDTASRLPWRCRLFGHSAVKKFSGWIICSRCGKKLGFG